MYEEKVKYPAVFVLSARREDPRTGEVTIWAFPDGITVHDDQEMRERLNTLLALEYAGALGYTKTLANLDDVDDVIAERRAELEAELASGTRYDRAGDAGTPPAPKAPEQEPGTDHSTTDATGGQTAGRNGHSEAALVVLYQGMAPRPHDTRGASGRLLRFEVDGQETPQPARNIFEIRQHLLEQGYRVHYPGWQVIHRMNARHGQVRREVYRRNGKPERVHLATLPEATDCTLPRVTEEQKARWLAQAAQVREESGETDPWWHGTDPWYRQGGRVPCGWGIGERWGNKIG